MASLYRIVEGKKSVRNISFGISCQVVRILDCKIMGWFQSRKAAKEFIARISD